MSATVYRARIDGGSVVVDWKIVETGPSLDALTAALADGWVTSEAVARAAALAVGPDDFAAPVAVVETETEPESKPEQKPEAEPEESEPDDKKKSSSRKKK